MTQAAGVAFKVSCKDAANVTKFTMDPPLPKVGPGPIFQVELDFVRDGGSWQSIAFSDFRVVGPGHSAPSKPGKVARTVEGDEIVTIDSGISGGREEQYVAFSVVFSAPDRTIAIDPIYIQDPGTSGTVNP